MNIEPPVTQAAPQAVLHVLTFPEVLASKKPVSDARGYLVAGPDRRGANAINPNVLWRTWQRDVQDRLGSVPEPVRDYFVRTKHLTNPPKEGELIASGEPKEEILNLDLDLEPAAPPPKKKLANPPRFTCSYSQMQSFTTCPAKWAAEKYFKTLKWVETEPQRQGNVAHKILEDYLKGKTLSAADQTLLAPWKKYPDMMLRAADAGGELLVEHEICFTRERNLCGWWDNNIVWFRSKSDVFLIKDRKLRYFDWKHGKTKPDTTQIKYAIACADLAFGDKWDTADGKLIFLKEQDPQKAVQGLEKPLTKEDIPQIWTEFYAVTSRMESAWQTENFRRQSSGLCRNYCGNRECPHCG